MQKILESILGERLPKEEYFPEFDRRFHINLTLAVVLLVISITMFILEPARAQAPLPLLVSGYFFVQAARFYYYRTYGHYIILNGTITAIDRKMDKKNKVKSQRIYFTCSSQNEDGSLEQTEYSCEVNARKWNMKEGCPVMVCVRENAMVYEKEGVKMIPDCLAVNTSLNEVVG